MELQTIEERNRRKLLKVERSPMLMDWQNQHSKNGYITKSNPHQNLNDIHHRD
jgi:hypothetical protein